MRRFHTKYVVADNGCWLWTAGKNPAGYGVFKLRGKTRKAHRVALWLEGRAPLEGAVDGSVVRHLCDTPACVNPEHLANGVQKDNVADCIDHGRRAPYRAGEDNPRSKLTTSDVKQIRALSEEGLASTEIATMFGVTRTTVRYVVTRRTWASV